MADGSTNSNTSNKEGSDYDSYESNYFQLFTGVRQIYI